jgi:hydrogenase maturation protease
MQNKNIFILGLGNEILMDDGVGPKIARRLHQELKLENAAFDTAAIGGMELIEMIRDYKHVIIVDAIKTLNGVPGSVYYLTPDSFKETLHISNLHDISFLTALKMASQIGIAMPEKIDIIAVEIVEDMTFGEEFTPQVQEKYEEAYAKAKEIAVSLLNL